MLDDWSNRTVWGIQKGVIQFSSKDEMKGGTVVSVSKNPAEYLVT